MLLPVINVKVPIYGDKTRALNDSFGKMFTVAADSTCLRIFRTKARFCRCDIIECDLAKFLVAFTQ